MEDRLSEYGFYVKKTMIGPETIEMARCFLPDLIILVNRIPGTEVLNICYELRKLEQLRDTAIALVGFRADENFQIAGYEAGADDYIFRPSIQVLVHRLKALSRRFSRIN